MERKILEGKEISSIDSAKDYDFKWEGVFKKENKKGTSYYVRIRNQSFGSFAHPVDAARRYNDIIIKYNLPYPLNNIPGFLELQMKVKAKSNALKEYKDWELAKELKDRLIPKDLKDF